MTAVISLLFWLVVIPFCIGLIPVNFISPHRRNPGLLFLSGYFCMWALFTLSAIPAVLWVEYDNFKAASAVFTVLSVLCAIFGILLWYRNRAAGGESLLGAKRGNDTGVTKDKDSRPGLRGGLNDVSGAEPGSSLSDRLKSLLRAERIEWLLFFLLAGFQLYKAVAYASFDGDDAYYVVESLLAQETGTMYRILPYTGGSTGLDVRHVLAVFPMWIAFVAVKAGIHATILSHVVMPLVLIPLTYLLYYEIGKELFDSGETGELKKNVGSDLLHRENLPVFMILMGLFQIFGNVSIYTNETFFLTRTWQGKAVAGSLVIPALLWVFLQIYDKGVGNKRTDTGVWILLVCINMTAGACSSIAVFLVCILAALTTFCLAAAQRDWKLLLKVGAACIPNMVYMAVYVFMAYSYLL